MTTAVDRACSGSMSNSRVSWQALSCAATLESPIEPNHTLDLQRHLNVVMSSHPAFRAAATLIILSAWIKFFANQKSTEETTNPHTIADL